MTATEPPAIPLTSEVIRLAGAGFLRNTIREDRTTCAVCATPVDGYPRCWQCNRQPGLVPDEKLATQVVPLVYAVDKTGDDRWGQGAHLMRSYKDPQWSTAMLRSRVALLIALGLQEHRACMEKAAGGVPMSAWATVPSTKKRIGEHPIVTAVRVGRRAPGPAVTLAPGPELDAPARKLEPRRWVAEPEAVGERHVLLVDDTWTSGANAQSAAAALHAAGARAVTVLVVARWLNQDSYSEGFIRDRLHAPGVRDYHPSVCPVTGGQCPP